MKRANQKKLLSDEAGGVALVCAFCLPMLIGFAGLGTDTIQWALWKRQIQRSADSSAIAGVYQRIQASNTEADVTAAVNKDLTVNKNDVGAFVASYPKITMPGDDSKGKNQVNVKVAVSKHLSFSGMFLNSPPLIYAEATAAVVPGADYCIISLEKTTATGIIGSGNASVDLDCGMITNSTSLNSAIAKGSSSIKTTTIAAVGGIQESNNWVGANYLPFTLPIEDPFASVPGGIPAGTPAHGQFNDAPNGSTTLSPGSYTAFSVQGNVTMLPGTYYLDNASVNLGSQATVNGVGVTIVLTNSNTSATAPIGTINMNAGANLNISAPSVSGTYQGIAIYQDRRASDSVAKINGHSSSVITGAVYMPNQELTLNGSGSVTFSCMLFVVKRVVFSGDGSLKMQKNCAGTGIDVFQGRAIRLIS